MNLLRKLFGPRPALTLDLPAPVRPPAPEPPQALPDIGVVIWREGRVVSHPAARIHQPAPQVLTIALPRVYATVEEVIQGMLSDPPQLERYLLQYIRREEPQVAVYLHEADVKAVRGEICG
jgi:hypothetical protein